MQILDSAFVDRADIIQYVDLPPRDAIYEILRSCLFELVKKGIIGEIVCIILMQGCPVSDPCLQDVPSLTQAVLYERTATFPSAGGTSPSVPNANGPGPGPTTSSAPSTNTAEQREKSKNTGLRLLNLAEKCRVGTHRPPVPNSYADFHFSLRDRHKACRVVHYAACLSLRMQDTSALWRCFHREPMETMKRI